MITTFRGLQFLLMLLYMSIPLACVDTTENRSTKVVPNKGLADSIDAPPKTPPAPQRISRISGPNSRTLCTRPQTITKNPETFDEVVALINALPKPVSVPCFLDTLEPPFYINATSNMFSGQPAGEAHSPRIFLFVGKALVVSVVPTGPGASVIELSFRLNTDESIKGELAFPVTETLSPNAPYTHILSTRDDTTICMSCHFPEKPAPQEYPNVAFVSRWISPIEDYDVTVKEMKELNDQCKTKIGDHCPVIQALFFRGQVYGRSFDL